MKTYTPQEVRDLISEALYEVDMLVLTSGQRDSYVELHQGNLKSWLDVKVPLEASISVNPAFSHMPLDEIERRISEMKLEPGIHHIDYPLTMEDMLPVKMPTKGLTADCGSVDGKNPGTFKFRIVDIESAKVVEEHIIPGTSTNNIAEFLGCVWAMRHNRVNNLNLPVYSDSRTALSWIKKQGCRTQFEVTEKDQQFMISAAIMFLKSKPLVPRPLFWKTELYGDIPADYGKKKPRKPKI